MGFACTVTDWSEEALENVNQIYNKNHKIFRIRQELDRSDEGAYDLVGAFEVLEHARNDEETLGEWMKYLKQNGLFIMSVPARMKFWSRADSAAGH